MGTRDPRYDLIKPMLSEGQIKSFADVFKYIKKTVVANDMGKKVDRFTIMMEQPKKFSVADVYEMAELFNIDVRQMFELIYKEELKKANVEQ
ncbi:hypothetical protein [Puia dinghuensis]|uniref:Uncharacterized protein n=1 Tax=Puia dinghuensis TaxID=1792502 RepID=A0A8J2UAB3_9BACT|nr:hypothetical protein [Puia dinghuensis]GGA90393.1 hypothetical protein GCM10011511_12020 [Puia dinghuensis]